MTQQNSKPRFRPVIRVFVSSTFSDLKAERNALQAQVFPRLEQLCGQNGFQFQAIDLRWGVSSEAGLDHRTMRICFDELRRAQDISPEPNFLVLLGNRYGWRPLPEEISQLEFEKLAAAANSGGENQSPIPGMHGKTARQVLCDWYRCDENVLLPDPPETSPDRDPLNYLLQPRTQNLGDGRDYTRGKDGKDTPDWLEVQQVLWRIINAAFPAAALDRRFDLDWAQHVADVNDRQHPRRAIPQIARFQASATEQEIWCGALSAANAERHVIACFREIANRDDFVPTEVNEFFDLTEAGEFDAASAKKQTNLKAAIKNRLGDKALVPIPFSRLKRENGKVVVEAPEETVKKFCEDVFNKFKPIIERQIEEYWNKTTTASTERAVRELKIEQDEHERFGRERGGAKLFVGREKELNAISNYLKNDSPWPLVIHGASGCGKTALMWRAFEEIPENRKPIIRLIGTTPQSSDVRSLLHSLCQKLRERNPREGELPTDIKLLSEELQQHFQSAKSDQPLILFLDALDQLSDADNGRLLNWIPAGQLPPYVKLVVSCLSDRAKDDSAGQPFGELTRRRLPAENLINLDALSEDDSSTLLFKNWLHQARRKVSDQQRKRIEQILKSKECCQPIYLKLLFEEARLWRSYDAAPKLGESVPAILGQLIERLGQPANHGRLLVERLLGYLAASRHGLAENEILEVLFADPEYKAALDQATEQTRHELPASATRIPIAIWSRLRFDLAPYLTERAAPGANVLTFYHRQVAEWVQGHFVKASEPSWQPHQRLADFFYSQADPKNKQIWKQSVRLLGELPFHLACAGSNTELCELFSQLAFLAARIATGQVYEQIADYAFAGSPVPPSLAPWQLFLQKHAQRLTQHPAMLVALVNHEGFPEARAQAASVVWRHPWLKTSPEQTPAGEPAKTEGLHVQITGNIHFPLGRVSAIAQQKSVAFCLERLGIIRVFDLNAMHQTDAILSIRRNRPLVLECAPDASSVAIFYESGKAELYQCILGQNGWPESLELVVDFSFYLPEIDNPVVVWHKGAFWYQATADALAYISIEKPRAFEEILPTGQHGELSALVFSGDKRLVAMRQGPDTLLLTSGAPPLRRPAARVATACACGERKAAAAFTDGLLVIYELSDILTTKAEVNIGMLRGALGWDGSRLLWMGESSGFNAWCASESLPLKVQDNQEIFPSHLHILPRQWQSWPDDSILLGTTHSLVNFRILQGGAATDGRLDEIFGGPVWRAVRKREKDQWLLEKNRSHEMLLGRGVMGRLYCAPDGKGRFFAASGYGSGLVFDLKTFQSTTLQDCPPGLNVAVGEDSGGCWFTDRAGAIYYADEKGGCRCVAKIGLPDVHGSHLENCGNHLIWVGYSSKYFPETGAEPARTFVFFRKTKKDSPMLERIGEQLRHPEEGLCVSFCYDHTSERLVTLWVKEAKGIAAYSLKIGSVNGFTRWQFQETDVCGLGPFKFVQANLSVDGRFLGVVNKPGEVSYLSVADGQVRATLAGSAPFTKIAHGGTGSEFWLVGTGNNVYKCALVEGTK